MLDPGLQYRLSEKKQILDGQRPLPAAIVRHLREQIALAWTHHSTALEGNTLTLQETALVLDASMTIRGHSLREHLEVSNHHEAVGAVYELVKYVQPVSLDDVLALHRMTVAGTLGAEAGELRRQQVYIRGTAFVPPPPGRVPELLNEWLAWVNGSQAALMHPVVAAALAKQGFVALHPFVDGNGRVSRLLMNLLLLRASYPPAVIPVEQRHAYLRALERANHAGQDAARYGPIVRLVARAVEDSLDLYLRAIEQAPALNEAGLLPLADLAAQAGVSTNHLRVLIGRGQLEAVRRGRRWYSSLPAWERARQQARRRGRPLSGAA